MKMGNLASENSEVAESGLVWIELDANQAATKTYQLPIQASVRIRTLSATPIIAGNCVQVLLNDIPSFTLLGNETFIFNVGVNSIGSILTSVKVQFVVTGTISFYISTARE